MIDRYTKAGCRVYKMTDRGIIIMSHYPASTGVAESVQSTLLLVYFHCVPEFPGLGKPIIRIRGQSSQTGSRKKVFFSGRTIKRGEG